MVRTLGLSSGLLLALAIALPLFAADNATPKFPPFDVVRQATTNQLAKLSDYKPGDLISRGQVEPLFVELKKLGWNVADAAEILKLVPADKDFFITELRRTDNGRKFMRQIAKYPLAYDRVDRLSVMIMGEKNVRALIRGPDGYKMIQYMTTTSTGKNLGDMLARDPNAADFNSPTWKLYTADALLARLAQSYDTAKKQAK